MPEAWLCIPSARTEEDSTLALWRKMGYGVALFLDAGSAPKSADVIQAGAYPGYSIAVNNLVAEVLALDASCQFCIVGGDDTEPDLNISPEEIVAESIQHFGGTMGVMQPTADRFATVNGVAMIEKVAGSAWIGREFVRRTYGGHGPLWPEYTRFFMDEELQEVATRLGVFQQRRDLIHLHRHYMRESDALDAGAIRTEIPEHLKAQEVKWKAEQDIFNKRKHARPTPFPGSEPMA